MPKPKSGTPRHPVVSRDKWLAARKRFLKKEKAFTRQRDALSGQRRALPWENVDKPYAFDGPIVPGMSDREGVSVFYRDPSGAVFHTYSSYARGIDMLNTAYNYLDLVPKGRDEDPDDTQGWVAYHDRY